MSMKEEEGESREVGERGGEVGKRGDPARNAPRNSVASESGVMWEHGESGEMRKEGEGEDGEWQEAVN